ncbi:MAG: DNA gyrase subunit A [Gammaproteobacteria bacterium]|nr:DNA gyrase subunit A [Gammaproteobacteria bacterium]
MNNLTFAKETVPSNLEQEMRRSYLDYAMSVIVGRALPDIRDGLKPVHRRVLYAMSVLGNDWNKPYKKSARVVGDVIGKYHPHGDTAVYDAIVRMAQDFSMRYPLVDGQGNFGSIDGDSPAAMRYTEIRLSKFAHELLADLDKETVEFGPNYDETETQPLVLPTRAPNLLVNGSTGIAVGMATNVPPHNLRETVDAALALIADPDISIAALMKHLPGPDFPTAGIITGRGGIRQAYETGRGRVYIRARVEVETAKTGRESLVVNELPYQVNKARLMEKIAELVKGKRIDGISAMRDESDKSGMRMVIELKRGETAEVVLNNLYKHTQMQAVFGINMVALSDNQPRLFNLKQTLEEFIKHRREVVTRRTLFELRKARERAHILEGLAVALANIDPVIAAIKSAQTPAEAKDKLLAKRWPPGQVAGMLDADDPQRSRPANLDPQCGLSDAGYQLSPAQAQAILDLRLHRLTGLEQQKIQKEYADLIRQIIDFLDILRNPSRLLQVISDELREVREAFGDERRTEIQDGDIDLSMEHLIAEEEVVVTLSHAGYAKAQPVADYTAQRRGGVGRIATRTREEDFVARMFTANSHDTILCFSDRGKVYWLRVFQLPQAGRQARGKPLVNLLSLDAGERITAILPIKGYDEGKYVVMATAAGVVKKCQLADFSRPRANGIIAVNLAGDDHLIGVALTDGGADILLFSRDGKAMRFAESAVRAMGRTARGVRGIRLAADDAVIALLAAGAAGDGDSDSNSDGDDDGDSNSDGGDGAGDGASGDATDVADENAAVLVSTENGYGKRTAIAEFPRKGRGGKGVIAIKTSKRNGRVVSALLVTAADEVMLVTDGGMLVRTALSGVSEVGRNTQGVRLIRLKSEERLVSVSRIEDAGDGESDDGDGGAVAGGGETGGAPGGEDSGGGDDSGDDSGDGETGADSGVHSGPENPEPPLQTTLH